MPNPSPDESSPSPDASRPDASALRPQSSVLRPQSSDLRPPPSALSPPSSGRALHAVAAFRGDLRAPLPLHPLETALIWIAVLNVCSLPWMMGGMRAWAQFISLGLSVLAFGLALIPRRYSDALVHGDEYKLHPLRRLVRWPLFWIGTLFFVYVLIQALNPAYEFLQKPDSWSMMEIDHIEWLPTGMKTPFSAMNPWRQMMIWGAPFLLSCALWAGLTRRKSVRLLVTGVAINCILFAVFALIQRATDAKLIYWTLKSSNEFFGAFIYRNHGGAYLVLAFMLTAGLAAWHRDLSRLKMARSSPAMVIGFFGCVILVAIGVSYSRGSVIALVGCLLWLLIIAIAGLLKRSSSQSHTIIVVILVLMFTGFGALGLKALNAERTVDRFKQLLENNNATWALRQTTTAATAEMWQEKPLYGWGAGGFRFLFPKFQQTRPEILWYDQKRKRGYLFWEYAHNDWIQIPAEVGYAGIGILGTGLVFACVGLFRRRFWRHPLAVICVGGCIATFGHSRADFLFYNPAIFTLWVLCGSMALIVTTLDKPKSRS